MGGVENMTKEEREKKKKDSCVGKRKKQKTV